MFISYLESSRLYVWRKSSRVGSVLHLLIVCIILCNVTGSAVGRNIAADTQCLNLLPVSTNICTSCQTDVAFTKQSLTVNREKECRQVYNAADQCSFILQNCANEEAGLFSYLQLYYCKMPQTKPVAFAIMVLWLVVLFSTIGITASDYFCVNLSTISALLGFSESITGVTFLAFGNGSPDVFSTFAALSTNSGSLAIGELIGAAGFITAVVAGSMALVRPFKVARRSFVRDIGFFVVAAAFSMLFLFDGHLQLWECAVMVSFYGFYVMVIVLWQWLMGRRRRIKNLESQAREHFLTTDGASSTNENEDGDMITFADTARSTMDDQITSLERSGNSETNDLDEEDDQSRKRWMAEISRNMRISRSGSGLHQKATSTIRPSLVGALEFRALLVSLEKSRSQRALPINLRRYSDDPTYTLAQQHRSVASQRSDFGRDSRTEAGSIRKTQRDENEHYRRQRAVSANDIEGIRSETNSTKIALKNDSKLRGYTEHPSSNLLESRPADKRAPFESLASISDTHSKALQSEQSATGNSNETSPEFLAPSTIVSPRNRIQNLGHAQTRLSVPTPEPSEPLLRPYTTIEQSSGLDGSSPTAFPPYHDDPEDVSIPAGAPSLILPEPMLEHVGSRTELNLANTPPRTIRWWPYNLLPSPSALASTLFPTLSSWASKSLVQRILALTTAPSVFLLTITLPVVEPHKRTGMSQKSATRDARDHSTLSPSHCPPTRITVSPAVEQESGPDSTATGLAAPLIVEEQATPQILDENPSSIDTAISSPGNWSRWLVCIQVLTAPLFVVLIVWANIDEDLSAHNFLLWEAYTMIGSLMCLLAILLTTEVERPPKYRPLFCVLGFVVSIAWISTIANEVVGVLKAFGVILGISEAILGLTIFAVGNSLGDLVANITIAKLGFPVMALSACFGGPMLNILLGVGLSGLYMTIQGGKRMHEKHPDRPIKYRSYRIEVGHTLIISGITLLITLVGLAIAVPMNKWIMDRRIGWSLVALWSASTIINLVIEATSST